MRQSTGRFLDRVRRLLRPASGRHRAGDSRAEVRWVDTPTLRLPRVPIDSADGGEGEDFGGVGLVRPYLIAHERRQARRRRALWLVAHGVDVGPGLLHGAAMARGAAQ